MLHESMRQHEVHVESCRHSPACPLRSGLLVSAFWWGLHEIKDHLRTSPNLVSLYPLLALGLIVTLLPPLMYLTLMDTFGVLHPLWPPHYIFIARQCLRTLRNNSLKVTAKEL
ncbi:hypothetical protein ACKKBF_B05560 [Auxenochlorella protothecoides x Auxenochlorella symbiontica]